MKLIGKYKQAPYLNLFDFMIIKPQTLAFIFFRTILKKKLAVAYGSLHRRNFRTFFSQAQGVRTGIFCQRNCCSAVA